MPTLTSVRPLGVVSVLALVSLLIAPRDVSPQATATISPVSRVSDGTTVGGAWSRLSRNDSGITMQIHTSDLEPGAAYTVWWVIFNNPVACVGGCGADDLRRAGVDAAAGFAAGHVIGNNGKTNFGGHLQVGDISGFVPPDGSAPILGLPPFGPGLLDARGAEVHLIIRTHGTPRPDLGLVDDQISSFNGACPPNICMNRQASIHK